MSNPFATPAAPAATATPAAAPTAEAPVAAAPADTAPAADAAKTERKKPAKQMTGEQIREVIARAKKGETPKAIADAMGLVRNQSYRAIKTYKDRITELMADETTPADKRAKLQAELDSIPERTFGESGGSGRTSTIKNTLDDLLGAL